MSEKINYRLLKAGDTLTIQGAPHYGPDNLPAAERGEEVQVETVHPEGVTVKTEAGKKVSFYFAHGAEKLAYTEDTKQAIEKRSKFGKAAPVKTEAKTETKSEAKKESPGGEKSKP